MLSPERRAYLSRKAKEQLAAKRAAREAAKDELAVMAEPIIKRQRSARAPVAVATATAARQRPDDRQPRGTPRPDPIIPENTPVVTVESPEDENMIRFTPGMQQGVGVSPYGGGNGVGSYLLQTAGTAAINRFIGPTTSTADFVPSGTGEPWAGGAPVYYGRRRRRRRRLLTASDKADIAYLVGQLGTGQIGRAAISALLSKRC